MAELSIIIPAYNAERTIAEALKSVLSQSYQDFEVIVIDDGSTDKTGAIIDAFAMRDNKIKNVHCKNGGQAMARTKGLSIATGNWILFLDADDSYTPGAFERIMNETKQSPDFVLFGFNIFSKGKLLRTPNGGNHLMTDDDYEVFKIIRPLMASACNKLYRRDYIKYSFDHDMVYGEDNRFNYKNLRKGLKIISISDCIYNVNIDSEGSVNKRYKLGRMHDLVGNVILQLHIIKHIFNSNDLQEQITKESIATIVNGILRGQKCLTKEECIEEMRGSLREIIELDSYKTSTTHLRLDIAIMWYLLTNFSLESTYQAAKVLNIIRTLVH